MAAPSSPRATSPATTTCVSVQMRDSDTHISFDLTPIQKSYEQLLCKQNGDRALWEYPFAVAGVNITFMLIQMLDLQTAAAMVLRKLFYTIATGRCPTATGRSTGIG
ncbi:uncharacterized protein [Triticum aestivum]|uniref:uncharacterized protein isoform X5 n=1 Tax=Triticum aestivum TaxID=4565 RepID=UPI001D00EC68|nr:uncharacterized protein LOC123180003 isoform X5 [Triticum aestivum]